MADNLDEQVHTLDEDNWKAEAEGVIRDVKFHVRDIHVSTKIKNCNQYIYLNLMTVEGGKYCIELSAAGFRVVGNEYDNKSNPTDKIFETPYSILDAISPKFRNSFGNMLMNKLQDLESKQNKEED